MDAPLKLFRSEGGEPTLHQVHSGAAVRREVDMTPGMPHQPTVNRRGLVRAGGIDVEVDVQLSRDRGVDRHPELPKFSDAVAPMELAEDLAALASSGEERRRPHAACRDRARDCRSLW